VTRSGGLPPTTDIPNDLFQYATEAQAEKLHAVRASGSLRGAARALDVNYNAVAGALKAVLAKKALADRQAAIAPRGTPGMVARELTTHFDDAGEATGSTLKEGPSPEFEPGGIDEGPARDGYDGFLVKGVSTYYDAAGQQRGQWVKTKLDDVAREAAIRAAIQTLCEDIPRAQPLPAPSPTCARLLNLYTITDAHVGMLAHKEEGGADWDLEIAERTLVGAFEQMILGAPQARTCLINQLGDFLHSDSLAAVTPTSGHLLDQDGSYKRMVDGAIRILRRIIDVGLMRHQEVYLVLAEGNHDMASSVWLRAMFSALYENEPRLHVVSSELPYYAHQHGKTMLAFHHGHMKRKESLPLLFASSYAPMWGATTKRYAHTGHEHHVDEKEYSGMTVIQHSTLSARDAYAARNGYMSERQATAITYHDQFGQVARNTVSPEMLGEAA
jgi:hypothetical protein